MISITPIVETHLPQVQVYASDPAIGASSYVPLPYPEHGAVQWFSAIAENVAAGRSQVFAIVCDASFCGVMALNDIHAERRRAELDYWVASPFQRRGIATQAATLAIAHAAETLALRQIFSTCLSSNRASARVLERCGFIETSRHQLKTGKFAGREIQRFVCRLRRENDDR